MVNTIKRFGQVQKSSHNNRMCINGFMNQQYFITKHIELNGMGETLIGRVTLLVDVTVVLLIMNQ